MGYSSLHCHTARGSNLRLLDSIVRIPELIQKALKLSYKAVAITDHDSLGAHVQALQEWDKIKEEHPEFKVILGNEIYLMDESEFKKPPRHFHFLLLAKDLVGYNQIKALSARAWNRSYKQGKMFRSSTFYQDFEEIIGEERGHLIASTACVGGELAYCILNKEQDRLNRFIPWCIEMFGQENFFLEMQDSDSEEQQAVNNTILRLSEFFDLKYILTSDVHYLNQEDQPIHSAFLNSKEEKERETEAFYKYTYLKSPEEMNAILSYLPQKVVQKAMDNTDYIYNAIESYDIRHSMIIPQIKIENTDFQIDSILTDAPYEYIQKFVHSKYIQDRFWAYNIGKGLREKFHGDDQELQIWLDRINTEMEVIWCISECRKQRMSAYFNLVQRIVDIIWEVTLVGVGRGSAPGFLTNYLVGITQFNPLPFELPYWRFLNLERLDDTADIDLDTDGSKSEEVLARLRQEFGDDCVLNTLTFHTESLKSAILTAARGKGISSDEAQVLSSMVPVERGKVASLAECLGEVEGVSAVPGFKEALENYGILDIVREIEGIESGAGVHASSVYIFEGGYLDHNGLMRSAKMAPITCWDMKDSDACGALKFDLLKTDATTKMTKCLQLLLDDGLIEWQGSLRATYNKYLHPDVIDFNDPKLWDAIDNGSITDLFQFITQVGAVAIQKVQPRSVLELSLCNDGMRLQGTLNGMSPIERFAAFKQDVSSWYHEMHGLGLTEEEIKVLERYALPTYGNSINQETLMRILMDPQIAKFTLRAANGARKILAKKLLHKVAELKEDYYQEGQKEDEEKGLKPARKIFLDYVWTYFIEPQMGYSFSTIHSHAYSIIGVQEAYLYTQFNPLYWQCACLSVNSGSQETDFETYGDEEDPEDVLEVYEQNMTEEQKAKAVTTNYGKVAKALGDIQARNIRIDLPDINRAQRDFTPDTKSGSIVYGLQAVVGMNSDTISAIISNRPYTSLQDFLSRVELTNVQMISLVKSGAFDALEGKSRSYIMDQYLRFAAQKKISCKNNLTFAALGKLADYGIIPEQFMMQSKMYYFKKWIDEHFKIKGIDGKNRYQLTETDEKKFFEAIVKNSLTIEKDYDIIPQGYLIKASNFDKFYKTFMEPLRTWMSSDEALDALYEAELQDQIKEWEFKYCMGSQSKWEMDALSYYYSGHELRDVSEAKYGVVNFNDLPLQPASKTMQKNPKTGVEYAVYDTVRIMGTVLNADKAKHIVTLLTTHGVVDVKFYKMAFINYNKRITKINEKGKKEVIEGSWFTRGNMLLVAGIRRDNMFHPRRDFAKGYKTTLQLIQGVTNGELILKSNREKEKETK